MLEKFLVLAIISVLSTSVLATPISIGDKGNNPQEKFEDVSAFFKSPSEYLQSGERFVVNARKAKTFDGNVQYAIFESPQHKLFISSGYKIKAVAVDPSENGLNITVTYETLVKPERKEGSTSPESVESYPTNTVTIPVSQYQ